MNELPVVVVTIGTEDHSFERLMGWCERWAQANRHVARMIVQHGKSRAPLNVEAYDLIPRDDLTALMERADVVVTHGGGGSITQCWQTGKTPIVVPRLGRLGEHVDEHQEAFGARLAELGYASMARSYAELDEQLQARLAADPGAEPVIDASRPSETALRIGTLIDDLVATRPARHRRSGRAA